jgi:outer membrane protein OmpA-like peptidoglycan-associated protein
MFFEKNKVLLALVFAPTRCKTALGIVKAYQKMHPGVQLDELREKFNIFEINPWCKSFNPEIEKSLFIPYSMGVRDKRHWFIKDDELININGRAFCFSKFWCGDALANLKAVSLKYRIFVAYSRKGKKGHPGLIKQLHIVLVYIFRHEDIAQYTDIENKTSEAIYDIDDEIVADEEADNYFEYHKGPSRDVRGGMSDGAQQGGNGNASGAGNSTGAGDGAGKNFGMQEKGPSRDVRGGMSDGAQQGGNGNASGAGNSTGAGDGAGKNFGMQEKEPSRDVRGGMSDGAQQGGNGNASGAGNSTGAGDGAGKNFGMQEKGPSRDVRGGMSDGAQQGGNGNASGVGNSTGAGDGVGKNFGMQEKGPSRDVRGGMSDGAQQGGNGNASGVGNSTGAGDGAGKNFGMQEKEPSRDVRGGMSDGAQQGGNGNASGVGNSTGKNGGYGKKFSFHKVIPPFFPYKLFWVVLIIIILLLIFLLFSLLKGCSEEKSQNVIDTSSSNTVRIQKLEAKFNVAHFDYNSAALTNQAQSVLQQLADVMKKDSTIKIEVDGYASEEGGAAYNQKLSEERAKSAVDYLIDCGVDSSRLKFVGEGCSKPIDKTNLGVNRRTEFIIIQ